MIGLFKHYRTEIARLQDEARDKQIIINELIDRLVHNKVPTRLATNEPSRVAVSPDAILDNMSDPLSAAEIEAIRHTEAQQPRPIPDAEDVDA